MTRTWFVRFCCLALTIMVCTLGWAQTKGGKSFKRAQPPKFDKPNSNFFADAFKDGLQGERPGNLGQPGTAVAVNTGGKAPVTGGPAAPAGGVAGSGWAGVISGDTLERIVKEMKKQVDTGVTTPSDFAGKGYKAARRDFSVLAMTFGIIGEYDGEVRWKANAPVARDEFARTAANSKVGTTGVFNEAKKRKEELQDLIGGANPFEGKNGDAKASWKDVCNRTPLMQHLESVFEPRLKPACSDKGAFTANADKLLYDAEIFAAIGAVLAKEGMEDADTSEYTAICNKLKAASLEIVDAVKTKNFDKASKAASDIGKSCTDCHENYRS
ncbi:cytochrome c [Anatilimnocola floriformis]|uniref:cytochrome c n=1 Tax=Anatilimnocola floriformis TaxID=2948575 RepID=UPI0020C51FE8|nr:cytochrome c [Anatilimnocola floriformis]